MLWRAPPPRRGLIFATGDIEVLLSEALFVIEAGGLDEWGGQGFGQLDLILAFRTDDSWFRHSSPSEAEVYAIV